MHPRTLAALVVVTAAITPASLPLRAQGSAAYAVAAAEAAANSVEVLRDDPTFAPYFATPELAKKLRQAHAKLALAKDALVNLRSPHAESEAYEHAVAAEAAFRDIEKELRWRHAQQLRRAAGTGAEDERAARQRLLAEIATLAAAGRETLARPASSWPSELTARAQLGRALQAVAGVNDSMPSAQLQRLRDELASAQLAARYAYRTWPSLAAPFPPPQWVEPPPRPAPPQRLRRAVELFLSGDYRGAVQWLSECTMPEVQATALAHLIRSAAGYYLFVESGERDQQLLAQARADAQACRASGAGVAPVRDAFSPRFEAFFREP
jgi:hypothetical protein